MKVHTNTEKLDICMLTYSYFLLIEKGICDHQNISSFHVLVRAFIWRSLHFLASFPFLFLFIVLTLFKTFYKGAGEVIFMNNHLCKPGYAISCDLISKVYNL